MSRLRRSPRPWREKEIHAQVKVVVPGAIGTQLPGRANVRQTIKNPDPAALLTCFRAGRGLTFYGEL